MKITVFSPGKPGRTVEGGIDAALKLLFPEGEESDWPVGLVAIIVSAGAECAGQEKDDPEVSGLS